MFFLSNLCSLCLSSYELFQKTEEILIQKKLIYCLPEIIDTHSEIPKYVCSDCMNKLECFYKFKQICLQNNTHLKNYFQTLTSTAGESYKYLTVKLTDIKYQNKLINQTMSTVGSDEELQTGKKEDNGIYIKKEVLTNETQYVELEIEEPSLLYEFLTSAHNGDVIYIKEEVVKNETQCVDEIEIEESSLLNNSENNIEIKEEILTPKLINCKSIPNDCDIVHEDSKCCNSNSKTNKKNYECALCKKKFMRKGHLVVHKKSHTASKSYECALCKTKFTRKYTMLMHGKIHTGIKNYECALCKKKFINKSYLVQHEQVHTSIKNYECALCKKKFIHKRSLVAHKKIHTGIKNYECAICKKKFIRKYDLVVHEKIHTGIKDYECSICKKKFMYKRNLISHEKDHIVIKN